METPDLVLGWLGKLEVAETLVEPDLDPGCESLTTGGKELPTTPLRKQRLPVVGDEASPTNTNFSSIFDSPEYRIASAAEGEFPSDGSLTTLEDDDDRTLFRSEKEIDLEAHEESSTLKDPFTVELSDLSSEHSVTLNPFDEALVRSTPDTDLCIPGTARQVFITSCYQCILAGLPCSRTIPACSRCKRAGCAHVCLLHRRKLLQEMVAGDVEGNTTPTLLRLQGENEQVWGKKVELLNELQGTWRGREEKKNWVLPVNNGRKGSFRTHGCKALFSHPGEGIGRQTFLELRLA